MTAETGGALLVTETEAEQELERMAVAAALAGGLIAAGRDGELTTAIGKFEEVYRALFGVNWKRPELDEVQG